MVKLPASKVRTTYIPAFALSVGRQNKRPFVRAHEYAYSVCLPRHVSSPPLNPNGNRHSLRLHHWPDFNGTATYLPSPRPHRARTPVRKLRWPEDPQTAPTLRHSHVLPVPNTHRGD